MTNPITAELRSAKADECCNDILCAEAADPIAAQDAKIKALVDALDGLLTHVEDFDDAGPYGEAYQSDELAGAIKASRAAIAAAKEPT